MKSLRCLSVVVSVVALGRGASAEDWPAYRHDLARSGVTGEQLPTQLHRQWVHQSAHRPMPAWPEPGRELNRLAFDYAQDVTIAGGLAYYGSSADHKVYCLDLATGKTRWSVFTGGPVRFALTVADGRVFVGSDDGLVYCLSATDGRSVWRFRGGPTDEKLMGNGQMISRWPVRTGVAVEKGIAYFAAGMWPSEGVYVYALRAADGAVMWENTTSGTDYVTQPHPGSYSMTGVSPQGYMLAREGQIIVPTGRSVPAAYDRATGKLQYYRSAPSGWGNRWGGCWNMLAGDVLIGWRTHIGPDIDVLDGEYQPHKDDGIVAFDAKTGKELREFAGKLDAIVKDGMLYASGSGTVTAYDLKAWLKGAKPAACTKWEAEHSRAYALSLGGNTLFVGGEGMVTAIDVAEGKAVWYDKVDGQARSLAVANGRLVVSTTTGRIICYGPEAQADVPSLTAAAAAPDAKPEAEARARRILAETGKREGYCVVLGASDGDLVAQLALQSKLTLFCMEPDAGRADRLRRRLDAAGLYGVRAVVHHGPLRKLAYPDYLADLIVVGDGSSRTLRHCTAAEVYRVLRPSGGVAWLPAAAPAGVSLAAVGRLIERVGTLDTSGPLSASRVARWLRGGGVPDDEIHELRDAVRIARGTLPGSDDWTHQYASAAKTGASADQVARVPFKLLWFGEPGPERMVTRHWGGPSPLCVNGRMFVAGQRSLIAADAYNGRELWRRDFTRVAWWPTHSTGGSMAADADSVYLVQEKVCLRLDAATGKTLQTYTMPTPPEGKPKSLRWTYLAVAHGRVLGAMGTGKEGQAIFALGTDGNPLWTHAANGSVGVNCISMGAKRVYAIDRTDPKAIAAAKRRGDTVPAAWSLVALDAGTGKVAWTATQGIEGRSELWLADGILVASSRGGLSAYESATGKFLYAREAKGRKFPVISRGMIYVEPRAYDLRTGQPKERENPFTGERSQWYFQRSYGCGAIAGSPNLLMFRSGTLGLYDLAGDGGVFNFGGVRAGCYVNAIAASGLVLSPPGDAGCTCSYSFRTTVALAPAKQQREWSVFFDRLPTTPVRQTALNLGAPGDRRDPDGRLWLALPRPNTRSHRLDIAVPFRVTWHDGFGPYRRSAERLGIEGTDRPWLYASGVGGIRRAELDLAILDRGIASWRMAKAPDLAAPSADAAWADSKTYAIASEGASACFRHDDDNLYVLYRRPGDPKGEPKEPRFDLFLSSVPRAAGAPSRRCVHVAAQADGTTRVGLWTYVSPLPICDVPKVAVTIDGKADDWGDAGLRASSLPAAKGKMRPAANFDPSLRLGWNDQGLVALATIRDDTILESAKRTSLYEGDSVEFFVTPEMGMVGGYQVIVSPGVTAKYPKPRASFYGPTSRLDGKGLTVEAAGAKTADGYVVEVLLPWSNLKLTPAEGRRCAVQVFVNDVDSAREARSAFTAMWHPGGHPFTARDPFAYQELRLAAKAGAPIAFTRGTKPDKAGLLAAVPPHPFPLALPPLGAKPGEEPVAGPVASHAARSADGFVARLAIPWKTLKELGLERSAVMADFASRGRLARAPRLGQGFERLMMMADDAAAPRTFSVRLHFAELDDVRRGERVFDVKLQGRTVLERFDVIRAARGPSQAVVRQFDGIKASRLLTVEFVPRGSALTPSTVPILSAIELLPDRAGK